MKLWAVINTAYGMRSQSVFKNQKKAHEFANIIRRNYPAGSVHVERLVKKK